MTGRARTSDHGNQFIGIYGACNDRLLLLGTSCSPKVEAAATAALNLEVRRVSVDGSVLLGLYCALNSNGLGVPASVGKAELSHFKGLGLDIHLFNGNLGACGNNVLANDKGAVANPRLSKAEVGRISECLGVEVVQMSIAGYNTVGAACIATNKGFLVHTRASEDELRELESALRVRGSIGTLNMGFPFPGLCALANSYGYVVGDGTSGFEMGRLDEGLGFLA